MGNFHFNTGDKVDLEIETIRCIDLVSMFNTELYVALNNKTLLDLRKTGALVNIMEAVILLVAEECDLDKLSALHALKRENEMLLKEASHLFVYQELVS